MEEVEGREERETSNLNDGVDSNVDDQAIERISRSLRIEKDQEDPSRLLNVFLPPTSQINNRPNRFHQFIARVTDVSVVDDPRSWDVNRTFLASVTDSSVINVHGLNAGHKYKVAILGRREAESLLIREEDILMDPVPLDFGVPNPLKRFPILDIHDLQEQREVELYIGNLSPGRDYEISVTSLREELPSVPWKGIVTTRPLKPENLNVIEINSSCVLLQWQLPIESGADRFKIAYGLLHGAQAMLKLEVLYPKQQIPLCQQIVPGRAFIFAVIAEKSRQISEPSTTSHTIKPLAPKDLVVEPDFESSRFRVRVSLALENESHTEKCQISVQSEDQNGRSEQAIVPAKNGQTCEVYFDLLPGRRYEFAAIALSGSSAFSTRMLRNRAVEPGFDFASFGLNLKEPPNNVSNSLVLEWPQSEVARLRIADLWARIVGRDSHLHFSIQPFDNPGPTIQRETGPTEPSPLVIDGLHEGECYKVLLYTVTSSGIVSERRFEQFLRKNAPQLDLAVGHLNSRAATIQTFYVSGTSTLFVNVVDSLTSQLIVERILTLSSNEQNLQKLSTSSSQLPSLSLDNLKPWRKYIVNGEIEPQLENDNSDLLNEFDNIKPWTEKVIVQEQNKNNKKLNEEFKQKEFIEKILDRLKGGHKYLLQVWAVNEAGQGRGSEQFSVHQPISAPPPPDRNSIQIVTDSIKSTELSARIDLSKISDRNGKIIKLAILVAELPTWGMVRRHSTTNIWPPFIALELLPDNKSRRFSSPSSINTSPDTSIINSIFITSIGSDFECEEKLAEQICNGPLKPGSVYRLKLRLFTSSNLWSDSPYTDPIRLD
uniref:Fibronectin type-III domain-containing protein n=2 Tax=Meloidogyne javanica TaxID=6303 RepID=A0A915MGK7_MELJA